MHYNENECPYFRSNVSQLNKHEILAVACDFARTN